MRSELAPRVARNTQHFASHWRIMEEVPRSEGKRAMSIETFRDQTRQILENLLNETPKADRFELIEVYADLITRLHAVESHALLNEVINDARTRLDARLSPDPVRQTIAGVQTTLQDIWDALWR